ncbi:MAG TPA: hypothetical protein VHY82_15980 [Acetobacteraceae bacterium]|nr:hypothetical protein [Acetobacteraceae bacterium]
MTGTRTPPQSVTFFKTKEAADAMRANILDHCDDASPDEYEVMESEGRPGCYVINVIDTEDGFVLGRL